MVILGIFFIDLTGTSSERAARVKEYGKTLEKACEKTDCMFHGIWGQGGDNYHFVAMIEGEDARETMRLFFESERPEELYHIVFKNFGRIYPE